MKQFTTFKVGYTSGIYGCSNEYFMTIYTQGKKHGSFIFYGLYGPEERVAGAMRSKGYKEYYTPTIYGKMTRNDIPSKAVMSEYTAVKYIKNNFKD